MFKNLFLPLIAVAAFIVVVGLLTQGKIGNFKTLNQNSAPKSPNLKQIKIENKAIEVEVAKTSAERAKGLGGRQHLDQDSGMIFVFSPATKVNFWMKDTYIALDLIWIKNNKIIRISKNVQPQPGVADKDLKIYSSPQEVDYVLEVNGGFSDKNNIKPNQILSGLEQL